MTSISKKKIQGLNLFKAYRIVSRLYFHLSILYIFFLESSFSTVQIAIVLACYGIAQSIFGFFVSSVIKRLGIGHSLILGEILKGTGLVLLAYMGSSFPLAFIAQIINGAGFSLAASSDPGIAQRLTGQDSLALKKLQSDTQSWMFIAVLVSGVIGGYLYGVLPALPLAGGAVTAYTAAVIGLLLISKVPQSSPSKQAMKTARNNVPSSVKIASQEKLWVAYYVLTRGLLMGAFVGIIPFLLFADLKSTPLQTAAVLAAFSVSAFISAKFIAISVEKLGNSKFAIVTMLIMSTAFILFIFAQNLLTMCVGMALMGIASGGIRPATIGSLAEYSERYRQGTAIPQSIITGMERAFGAFNALVILAGGITIYYLNVRYSLTVLLFVYLVAQFIMAIYLYYSTKISVKD